MSLPKVATRDEWLAARTELLAKEKDLTRRRDALNAERRNLPMVEIEKDYVFEGSGGEVRLIDMCEGRPQLKIYHFPPGGLLLPGPHGPRPAGGMGGAQGSQRVGEVRPA
jgi:predicted dithiol-disulfide oxidoreductase (DUF899 family)